ncbi:chorismate synthase [Helicovermis profundi]|uniref:Chorismate synthase n=1 Tax=Helicovermis profundi TaxID=3065157 RepID=A0AAU9E7H8_9FIRM|nr:chorismate synthase [Clostridia bacterium S502]
MSGIWSSKIKLSLFGESHGKAIGITIDGFPSGVEIDMNFIKSELNRRKPGKDKFSTKRKEDDIPNIISGVFNGKSTGTPLTVIIENTSQHSKDYEKTKDFMRPGHADYSGFVKYKGFNDYRGGGHFSGRITAPIVFAGAIAKLALKKLNIDIFSVITQISNVKSENVKGKMLNSEIFKKISDNEFPVFEKEIMEDMKKAIIKASEAGNSVGGRVQCVAFNVPPGLGSPYFDSVEGKISNLAFSIPAVKGIEFGKGFDFASMLGSDANDQYYIKNNQIKTKTNNNGGIIGGITTGMPLDFSVVFKPTPSIFIEQDTVDIKEKKDKKLTIEGRHDPCIVKRALPVVEAIMAIAVLDLIENEYDGINWW